MWIICIVSTTSVKSASMTNGIGAFKQIHFSNQKVDSIFNFIASEDNGVSFEVWKTIHPLKNRRGNRERRSYQSMIDKIYNLLQWFEFLQSISTISVKSASMTNIRGASKQIHFSNKNVNTKSYQNWARSLLKSCLSYFLIHQEWCQKLD